mmetsp:Transcript_12514/g.25475  ORF Transcript_12514/g.25475 Transcript_12514/m.25475 type:complete len:454 (+) Transcript_12514:122-1483(+)
MQNSTASALSCSLFLVFRVLLRLSALRFRSVLGGLELRRISIHERNNFFVVQRGIFFDNLDGIRRGSVSLRELREDIAEPFERDDRARRILTLPHTLQGYNSTFSADGTRTWHGLEKMNHLSSFFLSNPVPFVLGLRGFIDFKSNTNEPRVVVTFGGVESHEDVRHKLVLALLLLDGELDATVFGDQACLRVEDSHRRHPHHALGVLRLQVLLVAAAPPAAAHLWNLRGGLVLDVEVLDEAVLEEHLDEHDRRASAREERRKMLAFGQDARDGDRFLLGLRRRQLLELQVDVLLRIVRILPFVLDERGPGVLFLEVVQGVLLLQNGLGLPLLVPLVLLSVVLDLALHLSQVVLIRELEPIPLRFQPEEVRPKILLPFEMLGHFLGLARDDVVDDQELHDEHADDDDEEPKEFLGGLLQVEEVAHGIEAEHDGRRVCQEHDPGEHVEDVVPSAT